VDTGANDCGVRRHCAKHVLRAASERGMMRGTRTISSLDEGVRPEIDRSTCDSAAKCTSVSYFTSCTSSARRKIWYQSDGIASVTKPDDASSARNARLGRFSGIGSRSSDTRSQGSLNNPVMHEIAADDAYPAVNSKVYALRFSPINLPRFCCHGAALFPRRDGGGFSNYT